MTATLQITLIVIAFACVAGILLAAVLGRLNGEEITETEEREPLGDMVDVRAIVKRYSED